MTIKKETVQDISEKFNLFAKSMQGCNYVVSIESRKFEYQGDANFTLDNLREVFLDSIIESKKDISGHSEEVSISTVSEKIRECLSFSSSESGYVGITDNQLIINFRNSKFWSLVEKDFDLKSITKVFKHDPDYQSYFGFYVMWGFFYIFLNENNKTGIVIGAEAYD